MSKENYQCGSCEQFFAAPDENNECPHCGSGNWVKGPIDGTTPVHEYYRPGDELKNKYRPQMLAILKECTPVFNGEKLGKPIVCGTAGEMDKGVNNDHFKELFTAHPKWDCKPVENIWADTNKRSLSDLIMRADELKDYGWYEFYSTPDATHKNWIYGKECKLYKKYKEDMKKEAKEKKNWFGEQLEMFPKSDAKKELEKRFEYRKLMTLFNDYLDKYKERALDYASDYRELILGQVSQYLMQKHPGSYVVFKKGIPEKYEDGFHITSDSKELSVVIVEDLMDILEPSLGVKHTFIHCKIEDNDK